MANPIDDLKAIEARATTLPTHVYGVVTERVKCSCCGERDADSEFPGIATKTRDLRGRPVSTLCFIALLTEGKGAAELAQCIRARDSTRAVASFCAGRPQDGT